MKRIDLKQLEAGAGIEPANSGFADRDLTTWLPRHVSRKQIIGRASPCQRAKRDLDIEAFNVEPCTLGIMIYARHTSNSS